MRAVMTLIATLFTVPALAGESFTLDPAHSHVLFAVDRFGFTKVLATFDEIEGTLTLDRDDPIGSRVEATIHVESVESNLPLREEIIRGKFWLNAEQFPTIEFRSTGVERTGEQTAVVTGDLMLLGVIRPVSLDVTLNRIGREPAAGRTGVGFSAMGRVKRSDFGLETALGPVGDGVEIRIEALFLATGGE